MIGYRSGESANAARERPQKRKSHRHRGNISGDRQRKGWIIGSTNSDVFKLYIKHMTDFIVRGSSGRCPVKLVNRPSDGSRYSMALKQARGTRDDDNSQRPFDSRKRLVCPQLRTASNARGSTIAVGLSCWNDCQRERSPRR